MFLGFDEDDEAVYDSKEAAIERAKQIAEFQGYDGAIVMVQREHAPLWFAHLVRGTRFEWLAYYEENHNNDQA